MGKRVIIAEDETNVRHVLRDILLAGESDYSVEEAHDGAEAIEKIRSGDYDILLSDIMMPRMSGLELLALVKKEKPGLPVVVITAVRDEEKIAECLASGAWDYILKPFSIEQVRAAVRRALAVGRHLEQKPDDIEVVSSGPGWLELTAASEVEYLHRFRKFTEVMLEARLSPAEREDVRLAVEELGRNAIEWGNRYQHDRRVRLAYCLLDDRIVIRIQDEGEGFIPESLPDPSQDPIAHMTRRHSEGKRPGGYGIHIVKKIMDDVVYAETGNCVVMTKYLNK